MDIPRSLVRGAGNVVTGAGNIVTGTFNTVVGGGRRESVAGEITVKDKTTLTVKESPSKDALTQTALAVRAGFLMKRNEQGSWQKRYCCIVPHMYLYYFDSETAENPCGIIDLEYYTVTDITQVGSVNNVLKLQTPENIHARPFYFQSDDPSIINDWMGSIHRERYTVIRDEKNAYQQLQDGFGSQMDFAMRLVETANNEKDTIANGLNTLKMSVQNSLNILASTLKFLGVNDAIDPKTEDLEVACKKLHENVVDVKTNQERVFIDYQQAMSTKLNSLEDSIESLEKKLADEIQANRVLEAKQLQQRNEFEYQLKELLGNLETSASNYKLLWEKNGALEEKMIALSEQKRTLIKEVKTQRKKLDQKDEINFKLNELNSKLIISINSLKSVVETTPNGEIETTDGTLPTASDAIAAAHQILQESKKLEETYHFSEIERNADSSSMLSSMETEHTRTQSSENDNKIHSGNVTPRPHSKTGEESASLWEGDRSSVLGLDWLSNEQRALVMSNHSNVPAVKSSGSRRSSMDTLKSFFSTSNDEKTDIGTSTHSTHNNNQNQIPTQPTDHDLSKTMAPPPREPGQVPICYRCQGTVEGPKYSTCKCDIPMLQPEDPSATSLLFKGLLSKGKSAAGGFAGGLKKAGTSVGSLFSSSSPKKGEDEEEEERDRVSSIDSTSWVDPFGPSNKSSSSGLLNLDEGNSPATSPQKLNPSSGRLKPHGIPTISTRKASAYQSNEEESEGVHVLGNWEKK